MSEDKENTSMINKEVNFADFREFKKIIDESKTDEYSLKKFFEKVICNESNDYKQVIKNNEKIIKDVLALLENSISNAEYNSNAKSKLVFFIIEKCIDMHNKKYTSNNITYNEIKDLKHFDDLIKLFGKCSVFDNYKKPDLFSSISDNDRNRYFVELCDLYANEKFLYISDRISNYKKDKSKDINFFDKFGMENLLDLIDNTVVNNSIIINTLNGIMKAVNKEHINNFINDHRFLEKICSLIEYRCYKDNETEIINMCTLFFSKIEKDSNCEYHFFSKIKTNILTELITNNKTDVTTRAELFVAIMDSGYENKEEFESKIIEHIITKEDKELQNAIGSTKYTDIFKPAIDNCNKEKKNEEEQNKGCNEVNVENIHDESENEEFDEVDVENIHDESENEEFDEVNVENIHDESENEEESELEIDPIVSIFAKQNIGNMNIDGFNKTSKKSIESMNEDQNVSINSKSVKSNNSLQSSFNSQGR